MDDVKYIQIPNTNTHASNTSRQSKIKQAYKL